MPRAGATPSIDWKILDLVVYPETDIRLRMDTGPYTEEFPDSYDGLICTPAGRVRLGPSRGSVWETLILLAYPQGILLRGNGPQRWTVVATRDTWRRGGEVAVWNSDETCAGFCRGELKVTLRVDPLPGP